MRCQRCQKGGFHALDGCARCLRSLCASCFLDGCCGSVPSLSQHHYDRQGLPKPTLQDDRDEDGDEINEPTPTVPVDPSCLMREWVEIGGEG